MNIFFYVLIILIIAFIIRTIIKLNIKLRQKISILILVIVLIWTIFFSIDYIQVKNQKLPIFCTKLFGLFSYQDGGTIEYIGLGYKVIDFHKIVGGYSGWGEVYKLEEKYICPWFVSYEEAFSQIEQELFLENN